MSDEVSILKTPSAAGGKRLRLRAVLFYLVALLAILLLFAGILWDQHHRDLEAGRERAVARADIVAEWVATTFAVSEHALGGLAQLFDDLQVPVVAAPALEPERLEARLAAQRDRLAFIDELSLVDASGRVIASTAPWWPPGFDLSGRDFYTGFLEDPERDVLVTPLYWSPFGQTHHLVHARRLRDAAGRFIGIAALRLDPAIFGEALEGLNMTRGESIALLDTDMQLVTRRPSFDGGGAMEVLGWPVVEPLTRAFLDGGERQTTLRTVSPLDDQERLYAMQRVSDLPLLVVVGESVGVILAGWWQRLWLLLSLFLLVAGLGWWLLRHYLGRLVLEGELQHRLEEREQARREVQSREARLEALVGSMQDLIFVFDGEGRFDYVHAGDPGLLMTPPEALLGRHFREVLPAPMADQLEEAFARVALTGCPTAYDYGLEVAGEARDFHAVLSPLVDHGQGRGGALAVIRDVTEERTTEAQLRIAARAFETHLGMLITDAEGRILKVNETFTRITGYAESDVIGRNPRLLSSGLHDEAFYAALWARVSREGSWQGEIWNRRKNGEVYPEWLTISAVRDAKGELTHYVATFHDLTERKAAEHEIHQLAFYDPLTGLPNRRLLIDRLEAALKDSYRSRQFGALFYLDLDNFKQINDTLGHHAGDELLQRVAACLDKVLRDTDTLARLGGDEFAVLLHDLGGDQERAGAVARRVANKLLGALQAPIHLGDKTLAVTASLGITLFRDHGTTLDAILQQADMALFQAKEAGRNTLSFFDPAMQVRLQARARLEADLREALPRGELRLHYQVQVGAAGRVSGVEALLRWQHPERGLVSPGEFIPLAEENRLIVPIGHWVLEAACHQLVAWAADPRTASLTVSVNVSPRQFREPDFADRVLAAIDTSGAPAAQLKLEVTESLFVQDREDARAKMLRLRERGITFALDDFGTGYSSLAYLKRLPLDQLKIDQSFVRGLPEDEASAAIVASTIALSKSLGLEVIAEGVETTSQRDWLLAHGCRAFQGYLFGRSVPVEALALDD